MSLRSLRKDILTILERGPIRRYYLYSELKQYDQNTIRGRLSELKKEGKIIKKTNEKNYGSYDNDLFILQPPILHNIVDIEK